MTTSPNPTPIRQLALDNIDKRLIEELKIDGRQSLAQLGSAVGLSGDSVRDRLDRLTKAEVIRVTCSVNPSVLGYSSITLVGIKVLGSAERIALELSEIPEFDFVACTAGEFDVLVEAICRDEQHLLETLDTYLRERPDVTSITSFNYLEVLKFSPGGAMNSRPGSKTSDFKLDDVDSKIIEALRRDGRASFQELAETIGVPYQTTRRRVKFLLENDIVRPETVTNRMVEGTAVIAGVNLRTSGPIAPIAARLATLSEVEIVVHTTGSFDLLLEVACRDKQHLAELVGEELPSIPGVVSTETNIYLKLLKLPQSWSGLVRN